MRYGLLLLGFIVSCGVVTLEEAPTIKRKVITPGKEGAVSMFKSTVVRAENIKGDSGDKLAALLVESQFKLLKINQTSSQISSSGETGYCLALTDAEPFTLESLGSGVELSRTGRVVYSKSNELRANECQKFFRNEIPSQVRKDFLDLQISFFSVTF